MLFFLQSEVPITPAAPAAATEERVCISVPITIRGTAVIELTAAEARAIAEDQIPADERKDHLDPIEAGISAWVENTLAEAILDNIYAPEAESVDVTGAAAACEVGFDDLEVDYIDADLSGLFLTTKTPVITLAEMG